MPEPGAILEAFRLFQWYALHHTLACVAPAMFIAGAISTFLSKEAVIKYLGPGSKPVLAYSVASVAGMILAVCSCSVLPMFAGIYTMGAGLGPASAVLYSGPAINVLAVFLSARVLGLDIGVARTVGAVGFAVAIGLSMRLAPDQEPASFVPGRILSIPGGTQSFFIRWIGGSAGSSPSSPAGRTGGTLASCACLCGSGKKFKKCCGP